MEFDSVELTVEFMLLVEFSVELVELDELDELPRPSPAPLPPIVDELPMEVELSVEFIPMVELTVELELVDELSVELTVELTPMVELTPAVELSEDELLVELLAGIVLLTVLVEFSVEFTVELTPMVELTLTDELDELVELTTGMVELMTGITTWHFSMTSISAYLVIHATISSRPAGTLTPTEELLSIPEEEELLLPHWLPVKASMRAASSVQSQ